MPVSCHFHFFFPFVLPRCKLCLSCFGGVLAWAANGLARDMLDWANRQRECLSSVRVLFAFSIAIGASQAFCVLMGNPNKRCFILPARRVGRITITIIILRCRVSGTSFLAFLLLLLFYFSPNISHVSTAKRLSLSTDIQPNPV